jgi:hypothetical protein
MLTAQGFVPPRRVLWLGHLSEKNNRPAIARAAARAALGRLKTRVVVAKPDGPTRAAVLY